MRQLQHRRMPRARRSQRGRARLPSRRHSTRSWRRQGRFAARGTDLEVARAGCERRAKRFRAGVEQLVAEEVDFAKLGARRERRRDLGRADRPDPVLDQAHPDLARCQRACAGLLASLSTCRF